MRPIICGKPARYLSDIVEDRDIGYGVYMWIVADTSGYLSTREDAFELARSWFPELEDDEDK